MAAVQTATNLANETDGIGAGAWSSTRQAGAAFGAGHAAYVAIAWHQVGGPETWSVTIGGSAATRAIQVVNNGAGNDARNVCEIWYVASMTGGTADWVVSGTAGQVVFSAGVVEIDNGQASPLDQTDGEPTQAASITMTTAATSQADEIVVAVCQNAFDTGITSMATPTTGYTSVFNQDENGGALGFGGAMAYKFVAATGAQSATFTDATANFIGAVATFKVAAAGGGQAPRTMHRKMMAA